MQNQAVPQLRQDAVKHALEMKNLILIILIIALVVLVGTWPLSILAKIFTWIGEALNWLAKILNFFGWNGIL